jgi:hypothetical protein
VGVEAFNACSESERFTEAVLQRIFSRGIYAAGAAK